MSAVILKKPTSISQWLKLYRLYRAAFPPAEQKPFAIIVKMHRAGKSDVWCMERGGKFVGFATTVNGDGLILLDYFAVDQNCRGQGIGSQALGQLQRIYGEQGFFVEIEATRHSAPNGEERKKRKRFYQAAGMTELEVEACVFGVDMELLGSRCSLDFEGYRSFYRNHYSARAAEHIVHTALRE